MPLDPQRISRIERFLRTVRRTIVMNYVLCAVFFLLGIVAFGFEAHFVLASVRTQGQITKVAPSTNTLTAQPIPFAIKEVRSTAATTAASAAAIASAIQSMCFICLRNPGIPESPALRINGYWQPYVFRRAQSCCGPLCSFAPIGERCETPWMQPWRRSDSEWRPRWLVQPFLLRFLQLPRPSIHFHHIARR